MKARKLAEFTWHRVSQLSVVAWLAVSVSTTNIQAEETASLRIIPIPKEEHGYRNFESTVITSQSELDTFLEKASQPFMGWNNRADFEEALTQAKLDFERESLVLLRHTERSGSVHIHFRPPLVEGKRIICQVDRKEPKIGTHDMAFYCFALAVAKGDFTEVDIVISGREPILLSLSEN